MMVQQIPILSGVRLVSQRQSSLLRYEAPGEDTALSCKGSKNLKAELPFR